MAIQKNAFLARDPKLAAFFMTISGTLLSKRVRDQIEIKVLPSRSSDPDLLYELIHGGAALQVYTCNNTCEDKCLSPNLISITLPKQSGLYGKVSQTLQLISKKVQTDTALSAQEIAFLNSTMIPVLKIMAVELAFRAGGSPLSVSDFSEAIARDILMQYLEEVMSIVWDSVKQLKKSQINDHVIEEFRSGIAKSRKLLFAKRTVLFEQMAITLDLIEKTQQIEAKLQNMFVSQQQGTKQ